MLAAARLQHTGPEIVLAGYFEAICSQMKRHVGQSMAAVHQPKLCQIPLGPVFPLMHKLSAVAPELHGKHVYITDGGSKPTQK